MHTAYTMPGEPGSFGGARRPFVGTLFDRRNAQRYLHIEDAYTLHRQARRRFLRRKTHSKGIADLYQADLVHLSSLSNFSNSYLLTCIDVFTMRAWAIPLCRKTDREVTAAFRKILATSNRNPRMLQTDKGTEFLNAVFQRMLAINDIHWYSTENKDMKASVVERFNRTLKTKMSRYFTYKNLPRYIDVLPKLVASYNASYHRSIGMSPNEMNASNKDQVRKCLFPPKIKARRARWHFELGNRICMTSSRCI